MVRLYAGLAGVRIPPLPGSDASWSDLAGMKSIVFSRSSWIRQQLANLRSMISSENTASAPCRNAMTRRGNVPSRTIGASTRTFPCNVSLSGCHLQTTLSLLLFIASREPFSEGEQIWPEFKYYD